MDDFLARHRREQRDLQARITQKKKSATKKTRRGVNDECVELERALRERQEAEIRALTGGEDTEPNGDRERGEENEISERISALSVQDEELPESGSGDTQTATDANTTAPSPSPSPATPSSSAAASARRPSRQKARLARRAAEQSALAAAAATEAISLPDLRAAERAAMDAHLRKRGLREHEIRADGHCLYSSVADQLAERGAGLEPRIRIEGRGGKEGDGKGGGSDEGKGKAEGEEYRVVRGVAAGFIESHADDFAPFMEEPLGEYARKVRETGEWGGHLELLALARAYGVRIRVLHGDGKVDEVEPGGEGGGPRGKDGAEETDPLWLGYYRHGFGLGEHYNSLRRASS